MGKNELTGALEPLDFRELTVRLPELRQLAIEVGVYQFESPIDSSDMSPALWAKIARIIIEDYEEYDGFVILHGTDTMAYTASALSFMLENLTKPVILTGSQLPIGQLRTDGKENLITSIEIAAKLGLNPEEFFYASPDAYAYFEERRKALAKAEEDWKAEFEAWSKENPELRKAWNAAWAGEADGDAAEPTYKVGDSVATRAASGAMINYMAQKYSSLVGGSADLSGSNKTQFKCDNGTFSPANRKGRTIEYGIREFGMASEAAGMQLHGGVRPFCATYLVFSDYMRSSIRLAAIMKIPTIYVLTHDSIYVGEDGPTHQPIEHLASLRAIPNVQVLRPGDAEETVEAWKCAMASKDHPVILALTRQNVPVYAKEDANWRANIAKGAYIVKKGSDKPDVTILATGSEVCMALEAAEKASGKSVRVVSVFDKNVFENQSDAVKEEIIGKDSRVIVAEAGVHFGWEGFAARADMFCIDRFGESGPAKAVAQELGFTADKLAELINR